MMCLSVLTHMWHHSMRQPSIDARRELGVLQGDELAVARATCPAVPSVGREPRLVAPADDYNTRPTVFLYLQRIDRNNTISGACAAVIRNESTLASQKYDADAGGTLVQPSSSLLRHVMISSQVVTMLAASPRDSTKARLPYSRWRRAQNTGGR